MRRSQGFTLIELMIVVGIIALLAAYALPAYNDYVTRGKLQEAYTNLAAMRVKLEQYYQDNRMYSSTTGGGTCGLTGGNTPTVTSAKYFNYTCASGGNTATGDQTYTLTATGNSAAQGFTFTLDNQNTKKTTATPSGWTTPSSNCWVLRKDGSC